ncbi:MAG TPA: DnaJ domain-containing protein, partial [Pyrinomonadaceae bacterium]|nr:DnaJ domain-containing protein [Pyrinomonadaceae bacterium]
AYYALARKFHPDRFHAKDDAALRGRIEQAFTKIKKAYDTLKNEGSRASYDLSLGITPLEQPPAADSGPTAPPPPAPEPPPAPPIKPPSFGALNSLSMAEEKFKQGVREYESGNDTLAVVHFSEAVQLDRREPRYHAYYARALARNAQTRRMAETEFLEAISLDGRNVSYRVMLAELYRDLNLKRRAESQLTQALTIDPQHADVRKLLSQIRSAAN